jgi:hypothetical protein
MLSTYSAELHNLDKMPKHTVADAYWEEKQRLSKRVGCKELTNLR